MTLRKSEIVYRHEISPIPAENLQQHLESLPAREKRVVKDFACELSETIKGVGDATALEVIWAIGRLFNRTIKDES